MKKFYTVRNLSLPLGGAESEVFLHYKEREHAMNFINSKLESYRGAGYAIAEEGKERVFYSLTNKMMTVKELELIESKFED